METRFLIVGEDGRHVTLGRAYEPSADEVASAAASLAAQGLAGWYVKMHGKYYVKRTPRLEMLRPLNNPASAFDDAVRAFSAAHKAAVSQYN